MKKIAKKKSAAAKAGKTTAAKQDAAARKAFRQLGGKVTDWDMEEKLDNARNAMRCGFGVCMTAEAARELAGYQRALTWEELGETMDASHRTIRDGRLVMFFRDVPECII